MSAQLEANRKKLEEYTLILSRMRKRRQDRQLTTTNEVSETQRSEIKSEKK